MSGDSGARGWSGGDLTTLPQGPARLRRPGGRAGPTSRPSIIDIVADVRQQPRRAGGGREVALPYRDSMPLMSQDPWSVYDFLWAKRDLVSPTRAGREITKSSFADRSTDWIPRSLTAHRLTPCSIPNFGLPVILSPGQVRPAPQAARPRRRQHQQAAASTLRPYCEQTGRIHGPPPHIKMDKYLEEPARGVRPYRTMPCRRSALLLT